MVTTRDYPISRAEAEAAISQAVARWGTNHAAPGQLGYRNNGIRSCDGLVAFSFVESPRTAGAYKQIPYC